MMESMVVSSLVQLSTSGKPKVPVSLSTEPSSSQTPLDRVNHRKAKDPPPPSDETLVIFIDLEP